MKTVYLIGGTMGVGKTAVSQCLKKELPNAVFLDGDWCWDADPFAVTPETKAMVMDNICFMLNQFIRCSAYDSIVFCWVMHEQSIIDTILERINASQCVVHVISLIASKETLTQRITGDIEKGKRTAIDLQRSVDRIPLYEKLASIKIKTDSKSVREIADEIISMRSFPLCRAEAGIEI